MAGIAGALYVPQVGIINPGEFAPANSIEIVIWTAIGGRGTLAGPIIGAILVNAGKSWFTGVIPELWLFALGGLFVLVTIFLPKGIVGTAITGWNALKLGRKSVEEEEGEDSKTGNPKDRVPASDFKPTPAE
jgi:urea transport system permease protein